jgi:two-component system nitrogen regulation sensor histidine kinase NtrY
VIRVPYRIDDSAIPAEDLEFLEQLVLLYVVLFLLGTLFAFFLSNYISKNMRLVIDQLKKVRINGSNEKLTWKRNDEIGELIQEYNVMVEKLERTAVELAQSERESAWKEMAQQVAHEIKNPLTPMKLTLQMMEREQDQKELQEMASNLLEEVESLTHIAEAFSRFAQMPGLVLEEADIAYLSKRAVGLYADRGVSCIVSGPIHVKVDTEQWSRILHNLVKNAFQSIPQDTDPEVVVSVSKDGKGRALVRVRDNGAGIPAAMKERIFEPNFTTKSSGMGLGLALVKNLIENFGGTISFESTTSGTEFTIVLPLSNPETQK